MSSSNDFEWGIRYEDDFIIFDDANAMSFNKRMFLKTYKVNAYIL